MATDGLSRRSIAKEGHNYGYPMVDGYPAQYEYFEDRSNPESKAGLHHCLLGCRELVPLRAISTR